MGRESEEARNRRVGRIVRSLHRLYPDANCTLDHENPLQLLVATILSAQCTDERVNRVTPRLFERFPTAGDFARARPATLERLIRSTGFYKNKTKALISLGRTLEERYGGEVPDRMDELVRLPGTGRKTANVVLGTWFGMPAITVDTHVQRVAGRLALTGEKDPVKIERDLMECLPRREWTFASHALILHGRRVCRARRPSCPECGLARDCPWPDKTG